MLSVYTVTNLSRLLVEKLESAIAMVEKSGQSSMEKHPRLSSWSSWSSMEKQTVVDGETVGNRVYGEIGIPTRPVDGETAAVVLVECRRWSAGGGGGLRWSESRSVKEVVGCEENRQGR
ncbi:hypothetical protein LXL04_012839 [Taraxacum kok-saghyz]